VVGWINTHFLEFVLDPIEVLGPFPSDLVHCFLLELHCARNNAFVEAQGKTARGRCAAKPLDHREKAATSRAKSWMDKINRREFCRDEPEPRIARPGE
jgi:hypothetical protein